jgi:hypothetical protein
MNNPVNELIYVECAACGYFIAQELDTKVCDSCHLTFCDSCCPDGLCHCCESHDFDLSRDYEDARTTALNNSRFQF